MWRYAARQARMRTRFDRKRVVAGCRSDVHLAEGRLTRGEASTRSRCRCRSDGRRHRPGDRRVRAPRVALRPVPRRGRARARDDRQEPGQARREGWGGSRRDARAHRARLRAGGRRPDDRGDHRGCRREGGCLPSRGRPAAGRRDPRLEHELDPDHVARGGDEAAGAGDRHALLQSGAGAETGRGDPRRPDVGRDGCGDRRSSRATWARSRPRRTTSPASSRTGS